MQSVSPRLIDVSNVGSVLDFDIPTWERILSTGRLHGISGRWYDALDTGGLLEWVPGDVRKHLWSDRLLAQNSARTARWETDRLVHALRGSGIRILLLKGAAYIARGLHAGNGRISADIDILVPSADLPEAESRLQQAGWYFLTESKYDERYYRDWMHELPPMRHNPRGTALDVHHNLLPRTNKLCPDPVPLFEDVWPIADTLVWTLGPQDLVIHSALHGFYSGEFMNCYRDILDIHELVTDLSRQDAEFWSKLVSRTQVLGVGRAVFYALRYAARYFETPIAPDVLAVTREWGPSSVLVTAMDRAINAAFLPDLPPNLWQRAALQALYARSHWIKMPPGLLARHLWTKFRMRRKAPALDLPPAP